MKNFFKRIFFWNTPAAGAVFGWLLNVVYCFCAVNLGCLSDTFFMALQGSGATDTFAATLVLFLSLFILQLMILLYSTFLTCRFFYLQDRLRYKVLFWGIFVLHIAAFIWAGEKNDVKLFMIASGVLSVVGFNALCIRKNNYYFYIAAVLLWAAAMAGVLILINRTSIFELGCGEFIQENDGLIPLPWRVPAVYVGLIAFTLSLYSMFLLWAKVGGKPLREVWGVGCTVLAFLLVLCYLTALAFAVYEEKQSEKLLIALENNFQKKISAEALAADYFLNRKVDQKFHDDLKKALEEFSGKDEDFQQISSEYKILELPAIYQERFWGVEAEKLGRLFDQTIPAPDREYVQGNLCSILLPDLNKMRQSARFFTWQMKLASQAKNHDRAMQAWQRSERIVEYLRQEKSLIGSLVMIAVETIRLEGLEYMLAAGFLSDQELESIQKYLLKSAGKMAEVNRNALYIEAVFGTDTLIGMAKGTVRNNGKIMHEGLAGYRFLVPGLWYLGMKNYSSLLKFYNKKNLCQADEKIERNSYNIFSCMLIQALKSGGERMHDMEMRYQTFYALLEVIKIKRTTGKFPTELPVKITDYFSGKPLLYKAGSFDVQAVKLVERKKSADDGEWFNSNRKYESDYTYKAPAVQGIAVWSVGRNKVNDYGACGRRDVDGKTVSCDDIRALLQL